MVGRYLTAEQIVETNRRLLAATGGFFGVRDRHRIEYLVEIVREDDMFPSVWDKAAMYLHRLANSQAFIDGNKRTALEVADTFLDENGYEFDPPSPAWTVRYMLAVARNEKSRERVRDWLQRRSARKRRGQG